MELLTTLSKRLGIETYLEESQFGLLKTTLAIAGKKFVLDVELEADSSTSAEGEGDGDGDGDEMDTETPAHTPGGPSTIPKQQQQQPSGNVGGGGDGDTSTRGKVRLAKLMVNHITKDGETANSTHIANAIRQSLDAYLAYCNAKDSSVGSREDGDEVEEIIKRLWDDMSDLASLDILSESSGSERDWFVDLEEQANMIDRLTQRSVSIPPSPLPTLITPQHTEQ